MNNLESLLINSLGAKRVPIDQLDKSCCESKFSTFPVLDFDAIKTRMCSNKVLGLPEPLKSVDGLHIDIDKQAICFIEMKNVQKWILRQDMSQYLTAQEFVAAFDKWVKSKTKELKIKLIDSIFLLTAAAGMYSSGTNDVAIMLNKRTRKLTYVVLVNMDNDEYLQYNIASLEDRIEYPLLKPIHKAIVVITEDFDNFMLNRL